MKNKVLLGLAAKFPSGSESDMVYHPLLYHMLDVAAVAQRMWDGVVFASLRNRIAGGTGLDDQSTGRWVALLAGAHDLGKASPAFQAKDIDKDDYKGARARLAGTELDFQPGPYFSDPGHGTVTASQLGRILEKQFGIPKRGASRYAAITGAHHGTVPTSASVRRAQGRRIGEDQRGDGPWDDARSSLFKVTAEVLSAEPPGPSREPSNAMSLALAGLISVADWIGSNSEYFPAIPAGPSPVDYFTKTAIPNAGRALEVLGWTGWRPCGEPRPFTDLFPDLGPARPLQEEIDKILPDIDEQALVVVEAPTGEGKTEVALQLADHWIHRHGMRGVYIALPTQATSNQMFGRLKKYLGERYPSSHVNLQLLHGHAALSADVEILEKWGREFGLHEVDAGQGTVAAAEWFTQRKRGLLAPFGAGTIDQALMSVLRVRHLFVRLFGLAGKVVILDEVHAYDTYMTTLAERFLEWLAALGSPVVLLSATLPAARRRALQVAYLRGLDRGVPEDDAENDLSYPLISWTCTREGRTEFRTATTGVSDLNRRRIAITHVEDDPDELADRLVRALRDGGCAAVICNTVRRAQETYRALEGHFAGAAIDGEPELDLLHSRFLLKNRQERERRCLGRFGRETGEEARPRRSVLVGTQILEQSLDLDFDLMVTDLAPVDLVLQRAGRLHRHQRPARPEPLQKPELWIRWPEDRDEGPEFEGGAAYIYGDHLLLRTWNALRNRQEIEVPEDIPGLVEEVYDDDGACPFDEDTPLASRFESGRESLAVARAAEAEEAKERWLRPPGFVGPLYRLATDALAEDRPDFHEKHQALTRLIGPSVTAVVLFRDGGTLRFEPSGDGALDVEQRPDHDQTRRLLLNSVSISSRKVAFKLLASETPKGWRRSAYLRHSRLIAIDVKTGLAETEGIRLDGKLGVVID